MTNQGTNIGNIFVYYRVKIDCYTTIYGEIDGSGHFYRVEDGINLSTYYNISDLSIDEAFKMYAEKYNFHPYDIELLDFDFTKSKELKEQYINFFKKVIKRCGHLWRLCDLRDVILKLAYEYAALNSEVPGNYSRMDRMDFQKLLNQLERTFTDYENFTTYILNHIEAYDYVLDKDLVLDYGWVYENGQYK